ncbi:MAG TPA: choice-of-anchor tandem repeat GloVer-containing protein [Rhizomicrobium sp.]|nr:choice-of-anchor tandem repeat GloVer-containing protein [Rhizomicrobium sp.]
MRFFAELVTFAILLAFATSVACAEEDNILISFTGMDGRAPNGQLIADASGNLYGTTETGGGSIGCGHQGCGTAFRLATDGTLTTLHAFTGAGMHDGAIPTGILTVDSSGSLFGTTINGGNSNKKCGIANFRPRGCGTVFKIGPDGSETIVHNFGGSDGALPESGVVMHKGKFYGTTYLGGNNSCEYGCGTIFQLGANGNQKILYAFTGGVMAPTPSLG